MRDFKLDRAVVSGLRRFQHLEASFNRGFAVDIKSDISFTASTCLYRPLHIPQRDACIIYASCATLVS